MVITLPERVKSLFLSVYKSFIIHGTQFAVADVNQQRVGSIKAESQTEIRSDRMTDLCLDKTKFGLFRFQLHHCAQCTHCVYLSTRLQLMKFVHTHCEPELYNMEPVQAATVQCRVSYSETCPAAFMLIIISHL